MADKAYIYDAKIYRVTISKTDEEFSFFIQQIRKSNKAHFYAEIWSKNLCKNFNADQHDDLFEIVKQSIKDKFGSDFKINTD
jgi:hypothetical protein